MQMVADDVTFVIGGDTHGALHSLAVLVRATGVVLAERSIDATAAGYRAALAWAMQTAPGVRVWALEGTGHYGAGLTRYLAAHGEVVLEVSRAQRNRRRDGKHDRLDAVLAARTAIANDAGIAAPRQGAERDAVRMLLVARESAADARKQALTQLRTLLVTLPDPLRAQLDRLPPGQLLARACSLRSRDLATSSMLHAIRSVARRVALLQREAGQLERRLTGHLERLAPQLLAEPGIGPIVASRIVVAFSHTGRIHSEAAFARLAGTAPIPASSGQNTGKYRLHRGGDRRLNRSLHTVIICRLRLDPATRAYVDQATARGKTRRDAIRLLKRYLARHLYRILTNPPVQPVTIGPCS
jgi:transposase